MFRITRNGSSGNLVQCMAKNYKNGSIVSVDMDKISFKAAYSDPLCVCVCVVHCVGRHSYTVNYIHAHNTDLVHVNGHDRTILVIFS